MCHEIGGEINFLKNFEVVSVYSRVAYYLLEKKHYQINDRYILKPTPEMYNA